MRKEFIPASSATSYLDLSQYAVTRHMIGSALCCRMLLISRVASGPVIIGMLKSMRISLYMGSKVL